MAGDVGVTLDLASGVKNRENGVNPLRSRRCNRGRTPQIATASQVRGGKVRQVGRSGSQKTCPFVVSHSGLSRNEDAALLRRRAPDDVRGFTANRSESLPIASRRALKPAREESLVG